MKFKRILDIKKDAAKKSLFLFGPRQTGKTFLLKELFPKSPFYNLLLSDVFLKVSQRPQMIREEVLSQGPSIPQPIIIDEIQKLPSLLDEVHALIEDEGLRFILTGSSARKLKRKGANLLAGRAWTLNLFPLTTAEIDDYDLIRILNFGSLPFVYLSEDPKRELEFYVGTYLQEEIRAEGLVRNIESFSRFLQVASLSTAELVNFENMANDAQVPPRTVAEYFGILQDTLIGTVLEPLTRTKKRKAISTAKFYMFDIGVSNILAGRTGIKERTELFGRAFEHLIFNELKAFLSYTNDARKLAFWRSTSGYEVDFVIGDEIGIEVKGTSMATEKHSAGLRALAEDVRLKRKIIVSLDVKPRKMGDVDVIPVKEFLGQLWANQF